MGQVIKQRNPEEALASKLKSTFLQASLSGRLASSLQEVTKHEKSLPSEAVTIAVPLPAKPMAAKGSIRPCRRSIKLAAPVITEPELVITEPMSSPSSSSKRNRRVIGGVARAPTADLESPSVSPSPAPGRMVPAFRSGVQEGSTISSHLRVQPGSTLSGPSSKGRSSSRTSLNALRPAMAMDLDMADIRPPSSSFSYSEVARSFQTAQSGNAAHVNKATSKLPPVGRAAAWASGNPTWAAGSKKNAATSSFQVDLGMSAHQWDVSRSLF